MISKPTGWKFYMDNIAEDAGLSDRTVRKYLTELEQKHWIIKSEQGRRKDGKMTNCEIILTTPELFENQFAKQIENVDAQPSEKPSENFAATVGKFCTQPSENFSAIYNREILNNRESSAREQNAFYLPFERGLKYEQKKALLIEAMKPYEKSYEKDMLRRFLDYWSEPTVVNPDVLRLELENCFSLQSKLRQWFSRQSDYNK